MCAGVIKSPTRNCTAIYTQCNAMQCNAMQCNAMQCNAMQCNAMQCNAMQCNAMQCNAMQCNAMQCNAMQCNAMQCNAMQCNAMQCNAMQCNAMQCNAMQCNAMQCNAMQCNNTSIIPVKAITVSFRRALCITRVTKDIRYIHILTLIHDLTYAFSERAWLHSSERAVVYVSVQQADQQELSYNNQDGRLSKQ